ncbi:MAG TPA: hypothetical protein VLR69_19170 [Thermoanaerobaculia bacterium]|nr:hypothetical protein [Thermoanaerobaculia bacterium]
MVTCSIEEAREKLDEIIRNARGGDKVVILDDGEPIAEIWKIRGAVKPGPVEETLRQLEEEGVISRAPENRPSFEEILRELEEGWKENPPKPGGLARFLASRG